MRVDSDLKWELIYVVVCIVIIVLVLATGCVGVDPSASQQGNTIAPALTAEQIQTAVQTAINSNSSIVNDMWPVVVMAFIAVAGLVAVKYFNSQQTREVKDHITKQNGKNGHS